jgi:hypothetical protein
MRPPSIVLLYAIGLLGCSQQSGRILSAGPVQLPYERAFDPPFTARGARTYVCVGIPPAIDTKGEPPYRTPEGRTIEIQAVLTSDKGVAHSLTQPMYMTRDRRELLCVWEETPHRETPREPQVYVKLAVSGTPGLAFDGGMIESMNWR